MKTENKWPKLPKVFKRRWIAALRSGKFKQTESNLYDSSENAYCCLGVAGVVCKVNTKILDQKGYPYTLPLSAQKKYPNALLGKANKLAEHLAELNDSPAKTGKRRGFKTIATWIEKNL